METDLQQSGSHVIDIIISTPEIQTTTGQTMQVELLKAVMNNKGDKLMEILTNEQNQAKNPQNQFQVAETHLDEQGQDQPPQSQDQTPDGEENQAQHQLDEQGQAPRQDAHHQLEDEQGQNQLPQNMIESPQREENQGRPHLEEQAQAQFPEIQLEASPEHQGLPQQAPAPRTSRLLQGVTSEGDGVLHIVAMFKLVDIVNKISESWKDTVDVTMKNKRDETPLHCAAATGNVHIIDKLISLAGEDEEKIRQLLRMKKQNGETCLHDAVRSGQKEVVERLVKEDVKVYVGPDDSLPLVKIHDNEGVSPLYLATTLRKLEIVKFLTEDQFLNPAQELDGVQNKYPAASYCGPGNKTALHAAVLLCKDLSEHLANWNKELIDKEDESGSTPLHLLASTKDKIIMKLLLDLDIGAGYHPDNEGSLPIHVAAANGSLEIVKLLYKHRPSCSWSCNNVGQTILHIAVQNVRTNVVNYVCSGSKLEAIFNNRDTDGNTALHLAVLRGDQLIFCRLMRRSEVCLSFTNKEERTPLDLAQLSLPPGVSLLQVPRQWIMYALILAGADYGTCRSDHLTKNMAALDKEKESKLIAKSSGLVAVCAVLILTTAFAVPFTVTRFHTISSQDIAKSFAYRMFMIFDGMAFAVSAIATTCCTLAGFSFMDRGTRLFYLKAGGFCLRVAAMCIIVVFTVGVYVAVTPSDNVVTGFIYLFGALVIISQLAPICMMILHARALLSRLGGKTWCANMICVLPRQRRARISKKYRALCARSTLFLFTIVVICTFIFELGLLSSFSNASVGQTI